MGVSAATAFLRQVVRHTWPSAAAVLCAVGVDAMRPRGTCGTHSILLFPSLLAALTLCLVGIVTALRHLLRDRGTGGFLSVGITVYALVVTWLLVTV
jgi:hypothetical protein